MTLDASSDAPCAWKGDPRLLGLEFLKEGNTVCLRTTLPQLLPSLLPVRAEQRRRDLPIIDPHGGARIETGKFSSAGGAHRTHEEVWRAGGGHVGGGM